MDSQQRKIEIIDLNKKKGLSKQELKDILAKWQKNLLLKDWNINLQIVDFKRTDYKQSGDFEADSKSKKATIFVTWNPFLKNRKSLAGEEEETILHELIHIMLWDLDRSTEKAILKNCQKFEGEHDVYMEKLEELVDKLVNIFMENKRG